MNHCGLYFTPRDIKAALDQRKREPIATAFEKLSGHAASGNAALLRAGFLWRFLDNTQAGENALIGLENAIAQPDLSPNTRLIERIGAVMTVTQAYELLRNHPAFEIAMQARWCDAFTEQVRTLNEEAAQSASLVDELWMALLNMAAGVVLDSADRIRAAAGVFESVVRDEIRPQGFIARVVDAPDGGSMMRQILSASALVLMAELSAASGEGPDLWSYAVRGVSAATAAIYPIYYFYTTEKWKWDANLAPEMVQALFRQHGGYLEMVYRRTGLKDVATVLSDLRPLFDAWGGGCTTLSHGAREVSRRGLFG